MKKSTILTIAVIALVFMNIVLMGFTFLKAYPGMQPHRPERRQIIVERLGFDTRQQHEYARLIDWHRQEVERLDRKIRETKDLYYSGIGTMAETERDSLLDTLANLHKEVEQAHYIHFTQIRELCKGEQIERFDELAPKLPRIFGPPPPMRRNPGEKNHISPQD